MKWQNKTDILYSSYKIRLKPLTRLYSTESNVKSLADTPRLFIPDLIKSQCFTGFDQHHTERCSGVALSEWKKKVLKTSRKMRWVGGFVIRSLCCSGTSYCYSDIKAYFLAWIHQHFIWFSCRLDVYFPK